MPRRAPSMRPVVPESSVVPSTAMVASAVRFHKNSSRIYQPSGREWQRECYRHYAICGEARFAAKFYGHALSRAVLGAANGDGAASTQAVEILADLFKGKEGQKEMLEAVGIHWTIAGECYLVGREVENDDTGKTDDLWEIVSILEMEVTGRGKNAQWKINYADGNAPVTLGDDDVVIRLWLPDPAFKMQADSAFKSLMPVLSEIEWLTKHIFSQTTSRLAGNGLLFMPQEMTFPPPPPQINDQGEQVEVEAANDAEAFMVVLADGMITPIEDPGSPAARVPIVVTAPGEHIDKARWMQFWSELDAEARAYRTDAIHRFALGVDAPPEVILGMSSNVGSGGGTSNGVSHWGAWQIEEQTIKLHIEPMLDTLANSLTVAFLRPLLDDAESQDRITFDTSNLRLRPDRSQEALEMYDRGLIGIDALLREVGFDVSDKMGPNERKEWLLRKVATGSATPEQVEAALRALDVHLDIRPTVEQGEVREVRPTPSLVDHPSRPRTPEQPAAALLAASEGLVFRALERAGNRVRNTGAKPPNVPSYETHVYVKGEPDRLLADAWSCAPQVLEGIADPQRVVPTLNSYCAALITEGTPHTRERLSEWLRLLEAQPA
jgi:hypothetical protein